MSELRAIVDVIRDSEPECLDEQHIVIAWNSALGVMRGILMEELKLPERMVAIEALNALHRRSVEDAAELTDGAV